MLKPVIPRSPLRMLSPVLDEVVLRVVGRIDWADLSYEMKHPVILLSNHHVAELIVNHYYRLGRHAGPIFVLASFWLLRRHATVRRVIGNCF